ncbi:MAG: hypothetical protein E6Q56_01430 [Mycobacterium sp.]|nr:MAG: hypothetical protein E6Q56_01430 [Mycobacterium sp.]
MGFERLGRATGTVRATHRVIRERFGSRRSRRSGLVGLPEPQANAERLARILERNILPFWYPGAIDVEHGGYLLHHDQRGNWLGHVPKGIVSQARTLWFFSRLAERSPNPERYLGAAQTGFEFVRDRLWDGTHGGFFWEVESDGSAPLKADKHMYGQAFGLYALCAFAQASGSAQAQALATELVGLLESHARDAAFGGYREFLRRDWSTPSDPVPDYRNNSDPSRKTQDTHLHLLEAYTAYCRLTGDALAKRRLTELVLILASTVQRQHAGVATDVHDAGWRPLPVPAHEQVVYGHELEKIWLLTQASAVVDLAPALLVGCYRSWFSVAHDRAYDRRRGGFFSRGCIGQPAHVRDKLWWVQAEGLLAALQMFVHTGDAHYYAIFCHTLDWIEVQQADWTHGDWHRAIAPSGAVRGNKADAWKTPYHNGRAMIECLVLLGGGTELATDR